MQGNPCENAIYVSFILQGLKLILELADY